MNKYATTLYESILLELDQKYAEKLLKSAHQPFDNLFGDKKRIVIPFGSSKEYNELKRELAKIPNYSGFDPEKKEVIRTIPTKGPQGEGTKEQRLNLGTAISKLKIPEEQKKRLLNWYSNFSTNIGELEKDAAYSIVLSRHPIDVARMSDIGSIRSCHSPDGSYFHCALQEASTGGPVAYVVKTEDLAKLTPEVFDMQEIFSDKNRDIQGIKALSRLRVRRYVYTNKEGDEQEIAVPEVRIYGERIPNFLNTLTTFLREHQPDLQVNSFEKILQDFRSRKISRMGGEYSDSSDSELFNNLLDTNLFHGSVPFSGDEGEQIIDRAEQMEEELQEIADDFMKLEHSDINYDVQDNGDDYVYYNAWGSMSVDLSDLELVEDLYIDDYMESDSFYKMTNFSLKDPHQQNRWNYEYNRIKDDPALEANYRKTCVFIQKFIELGPRRMQEDDISTMRWDTKTKTLEISWNFGNNGNGDSDEPVDYRYFYEQVRSFDQKYNEIASAARRALMQSGFLKKDKIANAQTYLDKYLNDEFETEHFELDEAVESFDIVNLPLMRSQYETEPEGIFTDAIHKETVDALVSFYRANQAKPVTPTIGTQQDFKNFYESTFVHSDIGVKIELRYGVATDWDRRNTIAVYCIINPIQKGAWTEEGLKFVAFYDKNFDDFKNICIAVLQKHFTQETTRTKMYGLDKSTQKPVPNESGQTTPSPSGDTQSNQPAEEPA